MRFGGPIFEPCDNPEDWVRQHRSEGYSAAYCPIQPDADDATVRSYADAAAGANLLIAEVGAWSNPIDPDATVAEAKIAHSIACLELAERIGARCCVNITGSRNPDQWDGPHSTNFDDATFDMIVESTRRIIDGVKPTRTHYTLEMMPWAFPSSADEYLRLITAVDRPALGVHLDPVNLINCPAHAYDTGRVIRDCFDKLGPYIRSAHAKDIALEPKLTVNLHEVTPGEGVLDYPAYLQGLNRLDADTPLMMEHMPGAETYRAAARHIRGVAAQEGIALR